MPVTHCKNLKKEIIAVINNLAIDKNPGGTQRVFGEGGAAVHSNPDPV